MVGSEEVGAVTITKLKQSLSLLRKTRKNQSRRLRRKKSKRRFLKQLAKLRVNRISDELCERVQVFDIATTTGMECSQGMKDVAEWQNQHQLAYWKSRAVSLEYENKMLHQHIREMYVRQFEVAEEFEPVEEDKVMNQSEPRERATVDELSKPPEEAPGEAKEKMMAELYGGMAPKINGIETAVQLNYDYQLGTKKVPYWPNLPINL